MERSAREAAKYIAEKKSVREQREICVHREHLEEMGDDIYYVTPKEKYEDRPERDLVETFEPDEVNKAEGYERKPVREHSNLESGDRVVINDDVHTVTEVSSRQIVTNFGDKFRKSDGVEWGGGQKEITHKLTKKQ